MRLSYSKYRCYLECPQKYHWMDIRKEPSMKQSKYFALYGITVQRFFEFYVNKYVKKNIILSNEQIQRFLREDWERTLDREYVIWDDPWCKQGSEDIFESIYNDVLENISAFDFFKNSRSEVVYNITLKKSKDELHGRMDFINSHPDGTIEILDGKGSNKIDKHVDNEQLYFYALLYLIKNRKLPNKLGFWYYRYKTIKYIDFDLDTIIDFKKKLALVKKSIKEDTTWEPKVKITKGCKFCPYIADCPAYNNKKEENRLKKGKSVPITHSGSTQEFGF